VAEAGAFDATRGARGADDAHVEAGVVGDEGVAVGEREEDVDLIDPEGGGFDHGGGDAVDSDVPVAERVKPEWRADEPVRFGDDFAVAHLDESDSAGARTVRVGGFEVDGGEVEAHAFDRLTGR